MTTTLSAIRTFVMAFLILAGSLGAVFASSVQDAAASTTYGYWDTDGCYYTWGGPEQGFQRTTTCGPANHVAWGTGENANGFFHWDGTAWQLQGVKTQEVFALIFTDGHAFLYSYSAQGWYHTYQQRGQELKVETMLGWLAVREATQEVSPEVQMLISENNMDLACPWGLSQYDDDELEYNWDHCG